MILSILENSKVIKTQADNINFHLECDVLVMGAGSAGVYAADSAARAGAKPIELLLVIEANLFSI